MTRQYNTGALCGNQPDECDADLKAEAAAHDKSERQKRMRGLKILSGRRSVILEAKNFIVFDGLATTSYRHRGLYVLPKAGGD